MSPMILAWHQTLKIINEHNGGILIIIQNSSNSVWDNSFYEFKLNYDWHATHQIPACCLKMNLSTFLFPPEFPKGTYAVHLIISLFFFNMEVVEVALEKNKYCTNKVLKVFTNNMMRGLTLFDLFHSVRSQRHQIACFHFHSPANSIQCLLVFIILNSSFSRPAAPVSCVGCVLSSPLCW